MLLFAGIYTFESLCQVFGQRLFFVYGKWEGEFYNDVLTEKE